MISTSDGETFDSGYDFEASHFMGGFDTPGVGYSPGGEDSTGQGLSSIPKMDFAEPIDPKSPPLSDEARSQMLFDLHGNKDLVDKDMNEHTFDPKIDPNMKNYSPMGEKTLDSMPKYPSEMNFFKGTSPEYRTDAGGTQYAADTTQKMSDITSSPTIKFNKDAFNAQFSGTLTGQGGNVEAAAKKYGVPAELASAIIAQETGFGKSKAANEYNNPAGMMHGNQPMKFSDINEGLDHAVRNIAHQYNRAGGDLDKLANIYAPVGAANDPNGLNKNWLPGVKKLMNKFAGNSTLPDPLSPDAP